MNSKGIAVSGNVLIDYHKEIDTYPCASSLTTIRRVTSTPGGAVCNCGMDLARIDPKLPIPVIGIVGQGAAGDEVLKDLGVYQNIDCSRVSRFGEASFTDVLEDTSNHTRTFFHFRGSNSLLGADSFDFDHLEADILHLGYILLLDKMDSADATYGTVMARVLHDAQQHGIATSIDVVSEESDRYTRIVPPALRYTDYCIINELEASRTCGIPVRDEKGALQLGQVRAVCERLRGMGVRRWVVIHAREGAFGLDEQGNWVVLTALDIPRERIKGTTGAGDAFLAGTLYGAYCGNTIEKAIELGLAASGASLLDLSATEGVMSEAELRAFYEQTPKESRPELTGVQ
ncbi:MAG: carbohydrate kinase family protein [Clostridia bacterium]|nr:carbohydrate kinase family protein [Clostridia bacterium]